jgi:hypothetical protein
VTETLRDPHLAPVVAGLYFARPAAEVRGVAAQVYRDIEDQPE